MYEYDAYYDNPELPTRQTDLLKALRGRVVVGIERFTYFPPEDIGNRLKVPPGQLFSYCGGPVLITLDTGMEIGVGSDSQLVSVLIGIERTEAGVVVTDDPIRDAPDLYLVDVCDPVYSSDKMRAFLGKRIRGFRLLQVLGNPRYEGRPCQAGLVVIFEDGSEILFCHLLHDGTDDLGVITPDMMYPKRAHTVTENPLHL